MILGASPSLLGKEWIITKAYEKPDGSVAIEGWISTPLKDLEKDILEPEAFQGDGLTSYFQKGAPISSEHNTTGYPVGYLQKAVLVRSGAVLQEENNPRYDKAEFRFFDPLGTGWYGLGTIYEEKAAAGVRKGSVGSFSWIGHPKTWQDLPGGGRRFSEKGAINPLLEVTITAYPINQAAIMRIAKAHGYVEEKKLYVLNLSDVADLAVRPVAMHNAVDRAFNKGKNNDR
jgi:hypothetical protein